MEHVILALSLPMCFTAHIHFYRKVKMELIESGMYNIWFLFWSSFYEIASTIILGRIIWLFWKLFF